MPVYLQRWNEVGGVPPTQLRPVGARRHMQAKVLVSILTAAVGVGLLAAALAQTDAPGTEQSGRNVTAPLGKSAMPEKRDTVHVGVASERRGTQRTRESIAPA